jgi:hypothetical protein
MAVAVNFVVCDGVRQDPANPVRVDVIGMFAKLRSTANPPYPLIRPQFTIYLLLAEPDLDMTFTLQVVRADTGTLISRLPNQKGHFPGGPDQLVGMVFNYRRCRFPGPGLYWVECWSDGVRLARQRLYAEP